MRQMLCQFIVYDQVICQTIKSSNLKVHKTNTKFQTSNNHSIVSSAARLKHRSDNHSFMTNILTKVRLDPIKSKNKLKEKIEI